MLASAVFAAVVEVAQETMPWYWHVVGYGGQIVFGSRFYVQWIASERNQRSVIPVVFWWLCLAGGLLTLAYQSKLAVAQLRVFFLYGPGQTNMMISRLIDNVRNGATLTLPRDGDGLEFVPTYVEDTARVFVKACEDEWRGVWNVASPHAISFRALSETIGRQVGRAPEFQRNDSAAPPRMVPDLAKLSAQFDIGGFLDAERGLARTLS